MGRATKARGAPSPGRRRAGSNARSVAFHAPIAGWVDTSIEACWLAAAVLIPLVVLSEHSFVSFTGLPKVVLLRTTAALAAILLIARWAITGGRLEINRGAISSLLREPRHVLEGAILVLVALALVSTALSASPHFSLWGKDPGTDGYDFYTTASYAVLALAVASSLRTGPQLLRLFLAIAVTGTLAGFIGILQNYGFSPLGISGTSGIRVTGTSGNPIFFGALLALTLPVTLGLIASHATTRVMRWHWWALAGLATSIQVLALTLTLSRGPWVGTALGLVTLLALVAWQVGRRQAGVLAALLASAVAVTLVALSLPISVRSGQETEPAKDPVTAQAAGDRALGIDENLLGGLSGRGERWAISSQLAVDRPEIPGARNLPAFVRIAVGYGPDMFRYAFPILKPAEFSGFRTDAAHNDFLTRLVEIGLLGLVAYLAVLGLAVWAILRVIRHQGSSSNPGGIAIAAGLAGALIARAGEQFFGIPQAGDSTIFWILIGVAASSPLAPDRVADAPKQLPARKQSAAPRPSYPGIGLAVAVAVLLSAVTWVRTLNYARADHIAAVTPQLYADDPGHALEQIELATRLAPDVWGYAHRKALMVQSLAGQGDSPERRLALLRVAAAVELAAAERNPLSVDANLAAAHAAWQVAQAGDAAQAVTAIALYERLAGLSPQDPQIRRRLEQLRVVVKIAPAS